MQTEQEIVNAIIPIIKHAGRIVLSYFHTPLEQTIKPGDHGFVTQADLASEHYLIEQLSLLLPQASFFAEESGKKGDTQHGYCWVIDPLDGTTNFAHGLPYFCISIALTYNNEPVLGMIFQPVTRELWHAIRGGGAWCNGNKIAVSSAPFSQGLIALGLPYAKDQQYDFLLQRTLTIAHRAFAIRHLGAIALDAAYVACGRIEGMFFENLEWWDIAAGKILIEEAGGVITDFQGRAVGPDYRSCIAGSSAVHQELLVLLKI